MLLIGSRHRRDPCSEAFRFARSGRSRSIRRSTSTFRTPLLGFIDRPFVDMTVAASTPVQAVAWTSARDCQVPRTFRSCRSSRLQRFPPQRADPKIHSFDGPRVCCTPQPTMGFAKFRTPWLGLAAEPPTRRSWTRRSGEVVPCGGDPSKRSPPRQPRPCRHRASSFRTWSRSPAGRALSPFDRHSLPCRHGALRCSRPQGFLPPRSPLRSCDVAVARPLDAPLGFGSTRSRRCRAHRAAQRCWTFRLAARTALASPDPNVGGRQGVSALSGSLRSMGGLPEGRTASIAGAPAPPEGVASAALHCARGPMECQWIRPERESTASVRRPKAFGCRRHRDASPKRLVRDPALAPKSGSRWFELLLSVLPQLPAYMRRDRSPRTITPGGVAVCAPLARTPPFRGGRMLRRTHHRRPEGRTRWASRRHHPEVGPWRLVTPASPASWSAGSGPDSRRVHRDGRDSIRRRSLSPDPKIGMTGAEAPWVRSVRTSHRWW